METQSQNLLVGRRVVYKINATDSGEGIIMCGVLLKEALDKPVVSGFMILLNSGTLINIAYWRVVAVINNGNDTQQVFTKERQQWTDNIPSKKVNEM